MAAPAAAPCSRQPPPLLLLLLLAAAARLAAAQPSCLATLLRPGAAPISSSVQLNQARCFAFNVAADADITVTTKDFALMPAIFVLNPDKSGAEILNGKYNTSVGSQAYKTVSVNGGAGPIPIFVPANSSLFGQGIWQVTVLGIFSKAAAFSIQVSLSTTKRAASSTDRAAIKELFGACCPSSACTKWRALGGTSQEPCYLPNAYCSPSGQIETLDMTGYGLMCPFPTATFSKLRSLTWLTLSGNNLTGIVDWAAFSKGVPNLQFLTATGNKLMGTLGCEYATGPMLHLALGQNMLSGPLPTCLVAKAGMAILRLDNNNFTGQLTAALIPQTSKMQRLSLGYNQIKGTLPSLSKLAYLSEFDVSGNQIIGKIPADFAPPSALFLDVSFNQLTGSVPQSLLKQASLQRLHLQNNQFTKLPATIGESPLLQELFIQSNNLSGPLPKSWTGVPALARLDVSANRFTTLPASIFEIPSLQLFNGSYNKMAGPLPKLALPAGGSLLTDILLANNNLTGNIPDSWQQLPQFNGTVRNSTGGEVYSKLDLRNNSLSGSLPSWFDNYVDFAWVSLQMSGNPKIDCRSVKRFEAELRPCPPPPPVPPPPVAPAPAPASGAPLAPAPAPYTFPPPTATPSCRLPKPPCTSAFLCACPGAHCLPSTHYHPKRAATFQCTVTSTICWWAITTALAECLWPNSDNLSGISTCAATSGCTSTWPRPISQQHSSPSPGPSTFTITSHLQLGSRPLAELLHSNNNVLAPMEILVVIATMCLEAALVLVLQKLPPNWQPLLNLLTR
eukprot:SM000105S13850  [mRNA]  locus=s105:42768:47233:+ [translate_table: standard]